MRAIDGACKTVRWTILGSGYERHARVRPDEGQMAHKSSKKGASAHLHPSDGNQFGNQSISTNDHPLSEDNHSSLSSYVFLFTAIWFVRNCSL